MNYYGKIIRRTDEQNCIVHFFPFGLKKTIQTTLNVIIEAINHREVLSWILGKILHWKSG